MFDELFGILETKHGDDFNWMNVNERGKSFLDELNSELISAHPLYRKAQAALAKCDSKDDVLFLLYDNSYAIVHLTYSRKNTNEFPLYKRFSDLQSALAHIEHAYLSEYQADITPCRQLGNR